MTNTLRRDGNSDVLSVTAAAEQARLDKGDEMSIIGFDGVLIAGHVVEDPEGHAEMTDAEMRELEDVVLATRRRQLRNR